MNLDIKTITVFLPVAAAILFGMNYATYGRVLQSINVQTLFVTTTLFNVAIALLIYFLFPEKVNFALLMQAPLGAYMALGWITGITGWICSLLVMGNVSATYAAIGELSYPLFTALFAYTVYNSHELDWKMAIGGAFIMVGSIIVVSDKFTTGQGP